jgi:ABC-type phosphate transport system substrate-binding protein
MISRVWRLPLVVGALTAFTLAATGSRGFKVVANPTVPTRSLTRAALAQVFMKRSMRWPDGTAAVPVDLPLGSRTREAFSLEVHGKGSAAIDAFWQKQLFAGRDLPPLTKASDAEVVAYVRANTGAIGYVSPDTDTSGAKLIDVE